LWNHQVKIDRTIPQNKPGNIIRGNKKGTCMLINVAISGDRNVTKKEAEKILKYKDLTIEIQRMWNVKTKVIPVIIGATGTILKIMHKIREQHSRKPRSQRTTENSHIGHCPHTSESANVKAQ
jgi:hypothetical protein